MLLDTAAEKDIKSPDHYTAGDIEVIDYIIDQGWGEGFCKGSAVKYVSRAGLKEGSPEIRDIEKAKEFLDLYVERVLGYGTQEQRPELPMPDRPQGEATSTFEDALGLISEYMDQVNSNPIFQIEYDKKKEEEEQEEECSPKYKEVAALLKSCRIEGPDSAIKRSMEDFIANASIKDMEEIALDRIKLDKEAGLDATESPDVTTSRILLDVENTLKAFLGLIENESMECPKSGEVCDDARIKAELCVEDLRSYLLEAQERIETVIEDHNIGWDPDGEAALEALDEALDELS